MPTELLTQDDHSSLLKKLSSLPSGEAAAYRQSLEKLFEKHHNQLAEIFETITAYKRVADRIRLRAINDN